MNESPTCPRPEVGGFHYPGGDLTDDEVEFGRAVHAFQLRHNIRYPAWSDILLVLQSLGYRKQNPIPNGNADDADSRADKDDSSGLKGRFRQPRP